MPENGATSSLNGFDDHDNQATYIYTPAATTGVDAPERPAKRQKVKASYRPTSAHETPAFSFGTLLNGRESDDCLRMREQRFERHWSDTKAKIEAITAKANEDTLADVTTFVQNPESFRDTIQLPTGFIATGPNIASQGSLFTQLGERLKEEVSGPVVTLRSGVASNMKAVLKHIIRDTANQRFVEAEDEMAYEQDGRKLLNYDLAILQGYVKTYGYERVIISFQDSEAFDASLLSDLIILLYSWLDRIPFVLLFGIATSVDLFNERLSRAASRCIHGPKFDVEQTSSILITVFQKVIASSQAPLQLGPKLVCNLMSRQEEHVQSVQAFTSALKYAYMCHFFANPLTFLIGSPEEFKDARQLFQHDHFEAVRGLQSFHDLADKLLAEHRPAQLQALMNDDSALLKEISQEIERHTLSLKTITRKMFVLSCAAPITRDDIDLYMKVFEGTINESEIVRGVLESLGRMTPESSTSFIEGIEETIRFGNPALDVEGWADEETELLGMLTDIKEQIMTLASDAADKGMVIRSSHVAQNKAVRTTVIAQKIHLSHEKSSLSKQDLEFTELIDQLSRVLKQYLLFEDPQDWFLREVWLYDSTLPYQDVFTPRPRHAIEKALSMPHGLLLHCDLAEGILSSERPSTAILYQMYLESGSLINISDIWTAFFTILGGEDGESFDERTALMLFYRGLADLKLLGMLKQSKKKADHLAKLAWQSL